MMTMTMDGLDDSNDFVTFFSFGRFLSLLWMAFLALGIGIGMDRSGFWFIR